MILSSLSTLRPIIKIQLFLLLIPCTLIAMEQGSDQDTAQHISFNAFEIRAIAKFHALNGDEKDFSRYIAPRSIYYDQEGNVHIVDALNISIKTNNLPPMLNVIIEPLAINLTMNRMKLACTTFNQFDQSQSAPIEMIVPLDEDREIEIPIGLTDETGQLVMLSIRTGSKHY